MILESLVHHYRRLENDPDANLAPFGFSSQKIAFRVNLSDGGKTHEIEDVRRVEGKRLVPITLIVPGGAKPSGSGINPNFLWDNCTYLLGHKPDDENPERTAEAFTAFKQRHLDLEREIGDPEFSAVCRFLERWEPSQADAAPFLAELESGFGVFRMAGATHHVHEREKVVAFWRTQVQAIVGDSNVSNGQCLATGQTASLARLHQPLIKGVLGAQSAGAAIVSFNLDAFESYGKSQSLNAPVSEQAAFQYATALNHLLRPGSPQRIQIGDATVVFWTEQPTQAEEFFGLIFEPTAAEDDAVKSRLHSALGRIANGEFPAELGEPDTPFYILGLAANASRLFVRFWYRSTVGEIVENLREHFGDLSMTRSERDPEFPAAWQILRETARESKDIPPLLSGALIRSVLRGIPYPESLYTAVIRRIRADRQIVYLRAAILKACLNRNTRFQIRPLTKELGMSLDPDRPEPAYQMGRLFAALEKAQQEALPGLNDTIKDRYFGSASATPGSVFPRLIRLSQHHLGKLDKGYRISHERKIREICENLDGFRPHLNLQEQGLFAIGYYHQRSDLFKKKSEPATTEPQE